MAGGIYPSREREQCWRRQQQGLGSTVSASGMRAAAARSIPAAAAMRSGSTGSALWSCTHRPRHRGARALALRP